MAQVNLCGTQNKVNQPEHKRNVGDSGRDMEVRVASMYSLYVQNC